MDVLSQFERLKLLLYLKDYFEMGQFILNSYQTAYLKIFLSGEVV